MKFIYLFIILLCTYSYSNDTFYYKNGKKVSLELVEVSSINTSNSRSIVNNSNSNIKYYKTLNNVVLGVSDEIIIKIKNTNLLSTLLDKYNLKIVKQITNNLYIVSKNTDENTLNIANKLSLEEGVESANPNFIKSIEKR